jgi:hypothetical protein
MPASSSRPVPLSAADQARGRRTRVTDESGGAPERLDALIDGWKTQGWMTDASGSANLIDVLNTRLNEADAVRLGRALRALADAGLIDESHVFVCVELGSVFVCAVELGSAESVTR